MVFTLACPKKKKGDSVKLKDLWGQTFEITNKTRTPQGAHLWAQTGTSITAEDIQAIDEGLSALFARAKCYISEHTGRSLAEIDPHHRAMKHDEYIVAVLRSTDVDSNGDPAIRIPPGQYAGTEYDKGGYVLIAGQMLAIGQPHGNIIIVPDHQANFQRMADAVGFEAEHIVSGHNLPTLYHENETHGQGKGHPFITKCTAETGAVGVIKTEYGESHILLTK